jgi:hypothetical protein
MWSPPASCFTAPRTYRAAGTFADLCSRATGLASQTHGRTLIYMLSAMAASIAVLGVSARVFMGKVECPECGEKTERGQGACKHCGAELKKSG